MIFYRACCIFLFPFANDTFFEIVIWGEVTPWTPCTWLPWPRRWAWPQLTTQKHELFLKFVWKSVVSHMPLATKARNWHALHMFQMTPVWRRYSHFVHRRRSHWKGCDITLLNASPYSLEGLYGNSQCSCTWLSLETNCTGCPGLAL